MKLLGYEASLVLRDSETGEGIEITRSFLKGFAYCTPELDIASVMGCIADWKGAERPDYRLLPSRPGMDES